MDEWNKNRSIQPGHQGPEHTAKDRDEKRREQAAERHEKLEDALEAGLEESFPGSDPVSITQPAHNVYDKKQMKRP